MSTDVRIERGGSAPPFTEPQSLSPKNLAQIKAVSALIMGIIIALAGLFLLLAAFQLLPHGANVISQWEIGSKAIGSTAAALGIIVAGYGIYCRCIHLRTSQIESGSTNPTSTVTPETLPVSLPDPNSTLSIDIHPLTASTSPASTPIIDNPIDPETLLDILSKNLVDPSVLVCRGSGRRRLADQVDNTNLIIKSQKRPGSSMRCIQNECITYAMSEELHFGVVPYTHYVSSTSEEGKLITQRCPRLYHPIVLQMYIYPHPGTDPTLDTAWAHKVIFFNWLTGRSDTKPENSIVDKQGRIWEIDNELTDPKIDAHHWLLERAEIIAAPIQPELLAQILDLPDQISINQQVLPEGFTQKLVAEREKMATDNLKTLKEAIRGLQITGEAITCKHIASKIYSAN